VWQFAQHTLAVHAHDVTLRFFAAKCLHHKLHTGWEEYGSDEQNVHQLREFLLACVESSTPSTHTVVDIKLIDCLCTFVLQCVPDVWETPVDDLIARWSVSQPLLLLRFLAALPAQWQALRVSLERRNV
jgi:hypothetical protein